MTHVSIKDASSQTYPEITFCRPLGNPDYKNTLKECNLTVEDYFDWYTWVGNGSDFCQDPKKLYEKLSQNLSLILPEMHVYGFNAFQVERFIPTDDNLVIKELPSVGRCLAYQIPEDKEVWEVKIQMENFDELRLSLDTPSNFLATFESLDFHLIPDYKEDVSLIHEVIDVLDYDGQECATKMARDQCIDQYIIRNLTQLVGCTTPFVSNKSNICTDSDQALEAINMHLEIINGNANDLAKVCPRSCNQVSTVVSNRLKYYLGDSASDFLTEPGILQFYFPKFVKVSKTVRSYSGLSLIAEVGGYVGLFLGVSINQMSNVIEKIVLLIT